MTSNLKRPTNILETTSLSAASGTRLQSITPTLTTMRVQWKLISNLKILTSQSNLSESCQRTVRFLIPQVKDFSPWVSVRQLANLTLKWAKLKRPLTVVSYSTSGTWQQSWLNSTTSFRQNSFLHGTQTISQRKTRKWRQLSSTGKQIKILILLGFWLKLPKNCVKNMLRRCLSRKFMSWRPLKWIRLSNEFLTHK